MFIVCTSNLNWILCIRVIVLSFHWLIQLLVILCCWSLDLLYKACSILLNFFLISYFLLLMISYPELVSFHFFIPGGNEDKVPFYKLKVLFPHSNLEIHG